MPTPADILRLTAEPGGNHFNLGVGYPIRDEEPSGHEDVPPDKLYGGFTVDDGHARFVPNAAGDGVILGVGVDGGRTSKNTKYARVELRELNPDGSKAAWNPSKVVHTLSGRTKLVHLAPKKPSVCIAQIHDAEDDVLELLTRVVDGRTALIASLKGTAQTPPLLAEVAEGDVIDWAIVVAAGSLLVRVNGAERIWTGAFTKNTKADYYFKVGCYAQSNTSTEGGNAAEYFEVELSRLEQWHSGWPVVPTTAENPGPLPPFEDHTISGMLAKMDAKLDEILDRLPPR